jgi:hypothetical protein
MPEKKGTDYSDQAELKLFRQLGETAFGLRFDHITHSGSEANFLGIKSQHTTFSRRLDSRTYFVHDTRYGVGREAGVFRGTEKEYFKVCRDILKQLKIPLSEVANQALLKEQTQTARVDRQSGQVHKEPVEEGKYFARLSRKQDGLPIWFSSMVLGLMADRRIGYLQLHWPEIPLLVLREARCLAHKVVHEQWRPPEQPDASVELVEAGILHSPPIGFFLDTYAAIRVIYRPKSERYGQKPVYFFDRHGKAVPIPRQIELPLGAPEGRPEKHG